MPVQRRQPAEPRSAVESGLRPGATLVAGPFYIGKPRRLDTSLPGGSKRASEHAAEFFEEGCGAQGRNRTTDTVIFSHVLYQLSYLGSREGGLPAQTSGLPNRRSPRCPPFQDQRAGRGCDSLPRASSEDHGPCTRYCKRVHGPDVPAARKEGRSWLRQGFSA